MEAIGFEIIGFFLQNTRGCTENSKSENQEISGRKIFRTTKPKAFATQTPIISSHIELPWLKLFQKNKKRPGTRLSASFSAWFLKDFCMIFELFITLYCINRLNFQCLSNFTSWDVWQYVYCNCLFLMLWRHSFWN